MAEVESMIESDGILNDFRGKPVVFVRLVDLFIQQLSPGSTDFVSAWAPPFFVPVQSVYSPLLRKTTNNVVAKRENVDNTHFNSEVKRIESLLLSLLFGSMCRGSGGILCFLLDSRPSRMFFPICELLRPLDQYLIY